MDKKHTTLCQMTQTCSNLLLLIQMFLAFYRVQSLIPLSSSSNSLLPRASFQTLLTRRYHLHSSRLDSIIQQQTADTESVIDCRCNIVVIPEDTWRRMAFHHAQRLYTLLEPGMTPPIEQQHATNSKTDYKVPKVNRRMRRRARNHDNSVGSVQEEEDHHSTRMMQHQHVFRALDSTNPIYNFLVDYYGVRGAGSVRRLSRWSPCPSLLLDNTKSDDEDDASKTPPIILTEDTIQAIQRVSRNLGGIFLEKAQVDDFGSRLSLRGMIPVPIQNVETEDEDEQKPLHGVLYHPAFLNFVNNDHAFDSTPFQWNYSLLVATRQHEPIFHCHGLHEWAMLYSPPQDHDNSLPPPSSAMFQAHVPLRVTPQVIAETIQTRGTNCTHFDALRFFAPSALSFNSPPYTELAHQRSKQVQYEQPACVHANMDLFKIALRLQPFVASSLIVDALEVALMSRKLDVEASPYDVSAFGLGVVAVETPSGRALYKKRQVEIMHKGNLVRDQLINAYETFLSLTKHQTS